MLIVSFELCLQVDKTSASKDLVRHSQIIMLVIFLLSTLTGCSSEHSPTTSSKIDKSLVFPDVASFPATEVLPDPLMMFDGKQKVDTAQMWHEQRRPELKQLFQYYMFGFSPPEVQISYQKTLLTDQAFDGNATLYNVAISFTPDQSNTINVLLAMPNKNIGPTPVFFALNKCGNQSMHTDPAILQTKSWVNSEVCSLTERGLRASRFRLEYIISQGYAAATIHESDIDPDRNDFSDGVHPHFNVDVTKDKQWGTLAAWSWGLRRVVDYFVEEAQIDNDRIAVMGHSRRGKAALLTAALDERIDLAIINQSGMGGASLSRSKEGETIRQINTMFPHWFNDVFLAFNDGDYRIPIDQHQLISLVAPRSILLSYGDEDIWAKPEGGYQAAIAAGPVWALLGKGGFEQKSKFDTNFDAPLAYRIRPGKHSVTLSDWQAFVKFANSQFK